MPCFSFRRPNLHRILNSLIWKNKRNRPEFLSSLDRRSMGRSGPLIAGAISCPSAIFGGVYAQIVYPQSISPQISGSSSRSSGGNHISVDRLLRRRFHDDDEFDDFNCTGGAGGLDHHRSKLPYAEQASLEIDRQIGKGLTVDIGYLMVQAHRLVLGNGLNVSCPQGTSKPNNPSVTTSTQTAAQGWLNPNGTISDCVGTPLLLAGKPVFSGLEFPNGGFLDYNYNIVNAIYHGLTLQAIERIGKYFNLNANYTYSHIIDNGNFTTFINLPQNQFDNKSERASSNQDNRHRFVANFTASAPASSFLRNFEFSSIITIQSGRPFTLFTGGDSNGDTNPVTDRVGLAGRNSYTGDPLRIWDLRLSRFFNLTERMRLDLAFDAFNVLNRGNVDEVFSVYGSPVFCGPGGTAAVPQHFGDAASVAVQQGQATCTAPPVNPAIVVPAQYFVPPAPNGNFGTPRTALNPRQLQFSLKFSF